jgi:hypothetical protein
MRVSPEWLRYDLLQLCFHVVGSLSRRKAGAIADPENMRVDSECLLAERRVEDHVRRLTTDARKGLQVLARAWHFTVVSIDQRPRKRDHVLRLGIE